MFPTIWAVCKKKQYRLFGITEQLNLHLHQLPPLFLSVKINTKMKKTPTHSDSPSATLSCKAGGRHIFHSSNPLMISRHRCFYNGSNSRRIAFPFKSCQEDICWVSCLPTAGSFCSNPSPSGPRRITWMNVLLPLWKDGTVPILVIILKHIQSLNQGIA